MKRLGNNGNSASGAMRVPRGRLPSTLALATALLLSGCGWQPLYDRTAADPASSGVGSQLAQISIDPVVPKSTLNPLANASTDDLYDSRAAQLLQNYLKSALNPHGQPSSTLYHLAIELQQETRVATSLGNGEATREDLIMTALYQLNDPKGQSVLSDRANIVTSYDILLEPYSDLSSRRDAQQRAALELSQAIQTRLAVFLRK